MDTRLSILTGELRAYIDLISDFSEIVTVDDSPVNIIRFTIEGENFEAHIYRDKFPRVDPVTVDTGSLTTRVIPRPRKTDRSDKADRTDRTDRSEKTPRSVSVDKRKTDARRRLTESTS